MSSACLPRHLAVAYLRPALGVVGHLRRRFARFKSPTGRTRCGELCAHFLDLRGLLFETRSEGLYFFLLLRHRSSEVLR